MPSLPCPFRVDGYGTSARPGDVIPGLPHETRQS